MYYNLFGRCCQSRPRNCNYFPQPANQQKNNTEQSIPPAVKKQPHLCTEKCRQKEVILKSTAFGGFVLPEGTEKRATFLVASLNLDTPDYEDYIVQLVFSSNIIADKVKAKLRFQIFRQEKGQCQSVPISAGILYYRNEESSEANSFILPVCDCDSASDTRCSYSVFVYIEEFKPEGSIIISNPSLTATVI